MKPTQTSKQDEVQTPRAKMQAENVRIFYGEHQAIKGINLALMENEVIAFIGPSGCGKSTFLRSFNRMNDSIDGCRLEGRILLDGEDIHAADMDVVKPLVGHRSVPETQSVPQVDLRQRRLRPAHSRPRSWPW